jgi:hypothetical protein
MDNVFKKAELAQKKARILFRGTSGSGKTTSALIIANELKGKGRIALVDTEKLSSTHNAKKFDYDVVDFDGSTGTGHHPDRYIKLIEIAEANKYSVLIIDSFSHVWMGRGGILDIVASLTNTKYNGNSQRAWNDGNALYQKLIDKIMFGNNMQILLTGRTKQGYEWTEENGKKKLMKVGMELQQRDGLDYEFDINLDFSNSKPGYAVPEKDRTGLFVPSGEMITAETGKRILNYFS